MTLGSAALLESGACGSRHSLLPPPADIPTTPSDPPGVFHASVPRRQDPTRSAGGGVGRSKRAARQAAVGEAIERYCASLATLPATPLSELSAAETRPFSTWTLHSDRQRSMPGFPESLGYSDDPWMTESHRLHDNTPVWVPAALVGLSTEFGALASSSGLAAHQTTAMALLRACEELIERDAFMATWLHGVKGRRVRSRELDSELGPLLGKVAVYDITPAYSPHSVACVLGHIPQGGLVRLSLGLACRRSWNDAVEKAYLELIQGILFAGYKLAANPGLVGMAADAVRTFDDHSVYYTANRGEWELLPIHSGALGDAPESRAAADPSAALEQLVGALDDHGIELLYRDLTTVDARQLGITVVRVLAPQLTPIHHDHRWPFLGGTTADLAIRYPTATSTRFPSSFPHPLG